ncbi:divergent PAP2 family protein [Synechococcus elongatus IITB7]|uniref:divergent PAP2 family protein n=1 Tax=Synechococcus elongatus TaxID=32046 RepID=UPI0030CC3BAF
MLAILQQVLANDVLVAALLACGLAQFSKLIVEGVRDRRLNWHVLIETGGMPSSHSALVAALATAVGRQQGWGSLEFAVVTVFAIIVMYDAAGVRWAAGRQARILNLISEQVLTSQEDSDEDAIERLKEVLGHTRLEVLVGAALGVAIALLLEPALSLSEWL